MIKKRLTLIEASTFKKFAAMLIAKMDESFSN